MLQATLRYYKLYQNTIYIFGVSSIYPPRNVSEITGKIAHGKQPRTHILSKFAKKSNISSMFDFPVCEVSDLSSLLHQPSLSQSTTVYAAWLNNNNNNNNNIVHL